MSPASASLACPSCGTALLPAELSSNQRAATGYLTCLRRCELCGIGYSNARENPTLIFRDPLHNLPSEVRHGALAALAASLNVRNRPIKRRRFGFSTSEDAITWTVFSFAAREVPDALCAIGERLFGLTGPSAPKVLLWGVPVPPSDYGEALRVRVVAVLDGLGESTVSRSEPDVLIDYGEAGVAVIEVKLHAGNDVVPPAYEWKLDRYLEGTGAFAEPTNTKLSALYELTRNWRVVWGMADSRPLRLVNLGPQSLFAQSDRLDLFERSLATSPTRRFQRVTWNSLLACVSDVLGGLPTWFAEWIHVRLPEPKP